MIGTPVSSNGHPASSARSTHPPKLTSRLSKPRTRRIRSSVKGASYDRILRPDPEPKYHSRPKVEAPTKLIGQKNDPQVKKTSVTARRIATTYSRSRTIMLRFSRFAVVG